MREMSMNGPQERYDRSYDAAAKVIAFLGPYLFWGTVGAIVAGIMVVSA
jgi:hypothetical protein